MKEGRGAGQEERRWELSQVLKQHRGVRSFYRSFPALLDL